MPNPKMIIIAGPTAAGKSNCALSLAHLINGEIVSADSMQVYEYMDIGTAKPTDAELASVKHHMISVVKPDCDFTAFTFKKMASKCIDEIYERGKTPILAGGTGFYINTLIYDNNIDSQEERNLYYRQYLQSLTEEKGCQYLFEMLKGIDPEYAAITHVNNIKRVIRALEYYNETGEKFSSYNVKQKEGKKLLYDIFPFILNMGRERLYSRIEHRVDDMLASGLIDEVARLRDMGYKRSLTSMQGLGYKEIWAYLEGASGLGEAVSLLKKSTRHFAKRQITWFKNQFFGEWLNVDNFKSGETAAKYIKEKIGL